MAALHFVAGLTSRIKRELVGSTGTIDQLLAKARLEEAKQKEFKADKGSRTQGSQPTGPKTTAATSTGSRDNQLRRQDGGERPRSHHNPNIECHYCGGRGHIARQCPLKKRAEPTEAQAPPVTRSLSVKKTDSLEAEMTTLKTLGVQVTQNGLAIGPRYETEVTVDGLPVKALIGGYWITSEYIVIYLFF